MQRGPGLEGRRLEAHPQRDRVEAVGGLGGRQGPWVAGRGESCEEAESTALGAEAESSKTVSLSGLLRVSESSATFADLFCDPGHPFAFSLKSMSHHLGPQI